MCTNKDIDNILLQNGKTASDANNNAHREKSTSISIHGNVAFLYLSSTRLETHILPIPTAAKTM